MKRITADIDKKSRLILSYYTIKAIFNIKNIKKIEITPSYHKNYHLTIFTSYPYTLREQFNLRRIIGDDPHRLSMDKIRNLSRNTFFYTKEKLKKSDTIL